MTVTVNGVTSNLLTTSVDIVKVTGTDKDVITGRNSTDATDSLSDGDIITGNGKTILRIEEDVQAADPTFKMSGVNKVDIIAVNAGTGAFYANKWSDVHLINLSGGANIFTVSKLDFGDKLRASVENESDQTLKLYGHNDQFAEITWLLSNTDGGDGKASVGSINDGNILVRAGHGDSVSAHFYDQVKGSGLVNAGDVALGNIRLINGGDKGGSVGHVNVVMEASASLSAAGTAMVGDVTIGDIKLRNFGTTGTITVDLTVDINGSAHTNAVGGDLTIGDISIKIYDEATYNSIDVAYSVDSGQNATVGDVTVGDYHVVAENAVYAAYTAFTVDVSAGTTGAGVLNAGDVTFGDVIFDVGANVSYATFTISLDYLNNTGNATVGKFTVGDVVINAADYNATTYLAPNIGFSRTVTADAGTATAGDMTVGDITVVGGAEFSLASFTIKNFATGKHAHLGDTTIGNIVMDVGASGVFDVDIDVTTGSTGSVKGGSIGNLVLGDINLHTDYNATGDFSVDLYASYGHAGNTTIGDITVVADDESTMNITISAIGYESAGDMVVGDIDVTLGYNADLNLTVTLKETSGSQPYGKAGSLTIGNIHVVADEAANFDANSMGVTAYGDVGDLTVGDIYVLADSAGVSFDSFTLNSSYGSVGSITLGDVTMIAHGPNGSAGFSLEASAKYDAAKDGISVGDVTLISTEGASATFTLSVTGSTGDIGDVVIGDVLMKGLGKSNDNTFKLSFSMDGYALSDMGSVTVGDMTLVSRGAYNSNEVTICITSFNDIGDISIGDVRVVLENTGTSKTVMLDFSMTVSDSVGGNVSIGDVVLRAIENVNATSKMDVSADFDLNLDYGSNAGIHNLTIGDVKVIGGFKANNVTLDNFQSLTSIFDITKASGATVTFGNVDYSRYEADATIGNSTHDFIGLGQIKDGMGDDDIYDTAGQNKIYLTGGGDDTVHLGQDQDTNENDANAVDMIFNFTHLKDTLEIDTDGNLYSLTHSTADYASFLTQAKSLIHTGVDVYMSVVGGTDMYVAVDTDDNSSLDWVVKLVGVTNINNADLSLI